MSAPVVVNAVRRGFYLDSVALMRVSAAVSAADGVEEASLMIGTPANLALLEQAGLLAPEGRDAGPSDLVIAVRAVDAGAAEAAVAAARDALLAAAPAADADAATVRPRTQGGALRSLPGATLALISVPGEYAAAEAHRALGLGLDVMIFSDNVPLDEEVALKRRAHALGRLVMGPDCGTALLSGVAVAFANAIPRGNVGVVSASGTGLQELSVLLAREGVGVSHGIGVGGRDLGDAVGGISTLDAIDLLAADPATAAIALVSKPPAAAVAERVLARLAASAKPAVACFIGGARDAGSGSGVVLAATLHEAAERLLGRSIGDDFDVTALARGLQPRSGGTLRGLYSGGTLCGEAQAVLLAAGLAVSSNAPVPGAGAMAPGGADAPGHLLIDLGADEYTRGRPHPMLDPEVRVAPLGRALADPSVGVVLLDVVLGFGAHPDPAGPLAAAVRERGAGGPVVVASVCGVDGDPQGLDAQRRALEEAGVVVAPSNARAAALAGALIAAGG